MSTRRAAQTLDQIRRILLLMAGGRRRHRRKEDSVQLELQFFSDLPASTAAPEPEESDARLSLLNERIHSFAVELLLLMQMETVGLVSTPFSEGRKRLRLGSLPSLRLLDEWHRAPALSEAPWETGHPAADRENAYAIGLGHVRALADALELSRSDVGEIIRRLHPIVVRSMPEDDLPGLVHGHGLRHALVLTTRGRPAFRIDRQRSRGSGVLYTPAELIAEIAQSVLDVPPGGVAEGFSVCDPACGSGQFLLAAAERLLGARTMSRAASDGASDDTALHARLSRMTQLYGVDLDPRAARIAAHNLACWAARFVDRAQPGPMLDAAFGASFPYLLGETIRVGDALSIESSAFAPAFRWDRRFPQVFDRERAGFDVVLGNPPWVSHGLRDREGASDEERAFYDRHFPAGAQYKLNLYPLFIELALRICRPGGRHGFLVPDSLLAGHHYSRIRERLLGECELLELTLLESAPWPGASTGFTVFYAVRRRDGKGPAPATVRNRVLRAARTEQDETAFVSLDHWVPAEQYAHAHSALRIFRERDEVELQTRMMQSPLRFHDVLWSYSGLIARYGQKSAQAEAPSDRFELRDARGREIHRDSAAREHWRPSLLSGAEVLPYRIEWRGGHLYLPESREPLSKVWKSGFDLRRYHAPKIFLRQTGDRLIAALDRTGYFCLNNLHLLGSREDAIPPLPLLGILMSAPVQRLYRIFSPEVSRPLAQVDLKIVESLPYPVDAHGHAIGMAPLPNRSVPQSRRALRLIEHLQKSGEREGLLALVAAAIAAASDPLEGGPLTGGEVTSLILTRMVELQIEIAHQPGQTRSEVQEVLDDMAALYFGLPVAIPS